MNSELRILTFEVSGTANYKVPRTARKQPQSKGSEGKETKPLDARAEDEGLEELVTSLNEQAAALADKLEREIRKYLPSHVSTQAVLQFEGGSLLISGTVTLLSWGGAIMVTALKTEIEDQLGSLVRASIQRVLQPMIASSGLGPMVVHAKARTTSRGSLISEIPPEPGQTSSASTIVGASSTQTSPQVVAAGMRQNMSDGDTSGREGVSTQRVQYKERESQHLLRTNVLLAILAVVVLALVMDRFLDIRIKERSAVARSPVNTDIPALAGGDSLTSR